MRGKEPTVRERMVKRYGCPFCGRWRSSKARVMSHMNRCWMNAAAKTCGTCEHHYPPTKGEPTDWISGYPGSPPEPRSCALRIENATAMPRGCSGWSPLSLAHPPSNHTEESKP